MALEYRLKSGTVMSLALLFLTHSCIGCSVFFFFLLLHEIQNYIFYFSEKYCYFNENYIESVDSFQ